MPTAIVVGATGKHPLPLHRTQLTRPGILGREIVKQLVQSPAKWTTIYALSRRKTEEWPAQVVHKHIDLLPSAEQMRQDLAGVEADYIFFAAYLQKKLIRRTGTSTVPPPRTLPPESPVN